MADLHKLAGGTYCKLAQKTLAWHWQVVSRIELCWSIKHWSFWGRWHNTKGRKVQVWQTSDWKDWKDKRAPLVLSVESESVKTLFSFAFFHSLTLSSPSGRVVFWARRPSLQSWLGRWCQHWQCCNVVFWFWVRSGVCHSELVTTMSQRIDIARDCVTQNFSLPT